MFDKFKEIQKLRELQSALSKESAEIEENGIKVTVNGKMEIEDIQLNQDLDKEDQERILKECINKAMKQIQMIAARQMSQMQ